MINFQQLSLSEVFSQETLVYRFIPIFITLGHINIMAAAVDFNGTWKLESSSENFEDLLAAMNINIIMRKAIVNLSPEITIVQDGDNFQITTKTAIMTREVKFKVGEEFEEKHPLKDKMNKCLATWEGDILVSKVLNDEESGNPLVKRSLKDGKMVVNQKVKDVEAYRIFVKA